MGINYRDDKDAARDLLASLQASNIPSLYDPKGTLGVTWACPWSTGTFLVDASGVVRARHIGELDADWIRRHLEPLVRS